MTTSGERLTETVPNPAPTPGDVPAAHAPPMPPHGEVHRSQRIGWLRAAVLGANDGIVSTAALILGVAAADTSRTVVLTAGAAALVSGAFSMAVGEYVSVSTQRDTERADIATEERELANLPDRELNELTAIYREKGLSPRLAREVAVELTNHDALGTHLVDELGITDVNRAQPILAASSSAGSFAIGAALPLVAAIVAPDGARIAVILVAALVSLALLGWTAARLGGSQPARPTLRVVLGGAVAMAATMLVGTLIGTATG
jgi:VIT1/CCC1 family predicted Fe2+/Mn2+ transporter